MVCRRQYALEEVITGKDLDWGRPLTLCLRRGMRVNMSMKFTVPLWSRACPRCRRNSEAPKGATIRWLVSAFPMLTSANKFQPNRRVWHELSGGNGTR